jgi:hypothetical protein
MLDRSNRLNIAALWAMMMITVVSSWYPFTLDLPKRVVNSAVQHNSGAWDLDGNSRVISASPPAMASALLSGGRFNITVEAIAAVADQTGPARLMSIGSTPYDPALMIGIDRNDVVLYVPCDGAASNVDADWRIPFGGDSRLVASLWIDKGGDGTVVSVQVNNQPRVRLDNRCPAGTSPTLPETKAPWALGNVASGHRPFIGRIVKLEMSQDGRSIDLLRAVTWQAPVVFWLLPERLFQPSNGFSGDVLAALWHAVSFALLGYFLADASRHWRTPQLLAFIVIFALILNGGKALVAGRHPAVIDLLLNVAAAVTFLYGRRHFTNEDCVAHRTESGRSAPR